MEIGANTYGKNIDMFGIDFNGLPDFLNSIKYANAKFVQDLLTKHGCSVNKSGWIREWTNVNWYKYVLILSILIVIQFN